MTEAEAKDILKRERYTNIYTWFDSPEETYPTHTHPQERSFIILEGSMSIEMNGEKIDHQPGDRFTIPAMDEHASSVGPDGCTYVTGER